ncbi:MAG: ferritin-like domain-containing protein [Herpetosiphon sp.]
MAIKTLRDKFLHDVGDIYDAEHRFLDAQQKMLKVATDAMLQALLQEHIGQTQHHIQNLEQVFGVLGSTAKRTKCAAAAGLVSEGDQGMKEASESPEVRDAFIANAAFKVEHYEIASYRGLISCAELLGQSQVVSLLRTNLKQEEQAAQKIEKNTPQLLQRALSNKAAGS